MSGVIFNNFKMNVDFDQAAERANVTSGENIATSLGKISKAYEDGFDALSKVIDNGSKNIVNVDLDIIRSLQTLSSYNTLSLNGVLFVVNSDGSIDVSTPSGASTNSASFKIGSYTISEPMHLSGCPSGGSSSSYCLKWDTYVDSGDGVDITTTGTNNLSIYVDNAITIETPIKFYPMLCTKTEIDISDEFETYALPNSDLTKNENEDRKALIDLIDNVSKNLIRCDVDTIRLNNNPTNTSYWVNNVYTRYGTTFTINTDGSITVQTDESGATSDVALIFEKIKLENSNLYLSGCPVGGSDSSYYLQLGNNKDIGNGVKMRFSYLSASPSINIKSGTIIQDPITFYPMLCYAEEYDISDKFVPYKITTEYNSEALVDIIDSGSKNMINTNLSNLIPKNTTGTWEGNVYKYQEYEVTVNSDGTIDICTTDGVTSSHSLTFNLGRVPILKNKIYHLSGCPSGGGQSTYYIVIGSSVYDTENGSDIFVTSDTNYTCQIRILSGIALSTPIKFSPMVCLKSEWNISQDYKPYLKQDDVINKNNDALIDVIDNSPKNFINVGFTSVAATSTKPSVTNNGDGSITINGTMTAATTYVVADIETDVTTPSSAGSTLNPGTYVCKGTGNSDVYISVTIIRSTGTSASTKSQSYQDSVFTYTQSDKNNYPYIGYSLYVKQGASFDNVTIKPMVCLASEYYVSDNYEKYMLPYEKASADIIDQANDGVKNLLRFNSLGKNGVYGDTYTENGVTFKIVYDNNHGFGITTSGLAGEGGATANLAIDGSLLLINEFCNDKNVLYGGDQYLSIIATAVSDSDYNVISQNVNKPPTLASTSYNGNIFISIYRPEGSNLVRTVYPMICSKASFDVDRSYQPYAISNKQLTYGLAEAIDNGPKNLIKLGFSDVAETGTNPSIINNHDGTITIDGEQEYSQSYVIYDIITDHSSIYDSRFQLPAGMYAIKGTGNPNVSIVISKHDGVSSSSNLYTGSEDYILNYTPDNTKPYLSIGLEIEADSTFDNVTISPMICNKDAWDVSYKFEPFALSNYELTKSEEEDRAALTEVIDNGSKNYCLYDSFTTTGAETVLDKGVINLPAGTYILSYKVTATTNSCAFRLLKDDTSLWNKTISNTTGTISEEFTITDNANQFTIYTAVANTISDIMICTKSEWKVSQEYEPYGLSNPDLTRLESEDRNALVEVIDKGAKNLSSVDSGQNEGINRFAKIPISLSAGTYVVYFGSLSSTDTDSTVCNIGLFYEDTRVSTPATATISRGNGVSIILPISSAADTLRVYASDTSAHSANDTVTFTGLMICKKAEWDISQEYEPYAPTNRELYEDVSAVYGFKSFLPENTDMDTVLTPGAYGIASGAVATTFTNLPEPYAGRVEVFYTYGQDRLMQLYYPTGYASRYYYFRVYTGSWSAWRKYVDESTIIDDVYGTTSTISPASGETYDLNDLQIGRFQVPNSTYASRVLNTPTTVAGYEIECFYNGASTYKTQIAWNNSAANVTSPMYVRHYKSGTGTGTGWSQWEKFRSTTGLCSAPYATISPESGETADLNDYTTPDFYRVSSGTYAARILNAPITDGGYNLIVREVAQSGYIRQEVIPWDRPDDIYVRYYNGTTWSSWVKMLSQNDVDSIPTASSTNPVSSGGVQTPLSELIDNGVKNLIPSEFSSGTNGTENWFQTPSNSFSIPPGDYILFFQNLTSDATGTTCQTRLMKNDATTAMSVSWKYPERGTNTYIPVTLTDTATRIRIYAGENNEGSSGKTMTFSGMMICKKSLWDISQSYETYALTNPELTQLEKEDRDALSGSIDTGVKNRIDVERIGTQNTNAAKTYTRDGVTFTVNMDGTITVERTSTSSTDATVWLYHSVSAIYANDYNDGNYIFSIGYSGSSSTIYGRIKTSSSDYVSCDNYITVPTSTYDQMNISIVVKSGFTGTATIKPMVCSQSEWSISQSYKPFGLPNYELNPKIVFAECNSAASDQVKVVTISDPNWVKTIGSKIAVKFANTNTFTAAADAKITLSVNGTENEIYYNTDVSPTGTNTIAYGTAGRYVYYIWDGTYWVWESHGADNNTTYSSMTVAEIQAGTATSARSITPARLSTAIRGTGTALTSGADLNSYFSVRGSLYANTTAIAKSCLHRPAYDNPDSVVFRLEVIQINSTLFMQKMYAVDGSSSVRKVDIYHRYCSVSSSTATWYGWRKVTDTSISDYTG